MYTLFFLHDLPKQIHLHVSNIATEGSKQEFFLRQQVTTQKNFIVRSAKAKAFQIILILTGFSKVQDKILPIHSKMYLRY